MAAVAPRTECTHARKPTPDGFFSASGKKIWKISFPNFDKIWYILRLCLRWGLAAAGVLEDEVVVEEGADESEPDGGEDPAAEADEERGQGAGRKDAPWGPTMGRIRTSPPPHAPRGGWSVGHIFRPLRVFRCAVFVFRAP